MIRSIFCRLSVWGLLIGLVALTGCLGGSSPEPRRWNLEVAKVEAASVAKTPIWDVVRVSRLVVAAPYDGHRLVVQRADGTLAFDSRNIFAASPAALLRVPTREVLNASGLARMVLSDNSGVRAKASLEIEVDTFALDCREEGRFAKVALVVTSSDDHKLVKSARGEARVAVEKDFTAAFSRAYTAALMKALGEFAQ